MPRCVATSRLPTATRWNTARNSSSEAGRNIRRSEGAGTPAAGVHSKRSRSIISVSPAAWAASRRQDTASATAGSASCPAVGTTSTYSGFAWNSVCARDMSSAASAARSGTSASTCRKSRASGRSLSSRPHHRARATILEPSTANQLHSGRSRPAATSSRSESASTNPTGSFIANPTGSSNSARVAGRISTIASLHDASLTTGSEIEIGHVDNDRHRTFTVPPDSVSRETPLGHKSGPRKIRGPRSIRGECQSLRTTTRRDGSAPSLSLETPATLATAS